MLTAEEGRDYHPCVARHRSIQAGGRNGSRAHGRANEGAVRRRGTERRTRRRAAADVLERSAASPAPLQRGASDHAFLEPRARHGVDPRLSTRARPVTQSFNAVLFIAVMPFVSR